jgi:HSP20 family protein
MSQLATERGGASESTRWEPLSELERLRRILEQSFGDAGLGAVAREAAALVPPVNIEEQDDAYMIEAELPGVDRDDVDVELVGNELTISGEFKEKERVGILRKRTRRTGRFEFRVLLPDRVEADGISAGLEHGVLTVRVPKAQAAQRRRIEVGS